MAYKPTNPPVTSEPNVVPMADIMLVLLIIFMVVTPMLQKGVSVDMATTDTAEEMKEADKDNAILIAVTRDGNVYLGAEQVAMETLAGKVRDLWEATSTKIVYLKSDRNATFGDVSRVVDEIRTAGVDKLGLLTEKRDTGAQDPVLPSLPAGERDAEEGKGD